MIKHCIECGSELKEGHKYCSDCGSKLLDELPEKISHCPDCGAKIEEIRKFCPECGYKFSSQTKLEDTVSKEPIEYIVEDKSSDELEKIFNKRREEKSSKSAKKQEEKHNKTSKQKMALAVLIVAIVIFILFVGIYLNNQRQSQIPYYPQYNYPSWKEIDSFELSSGGTNRQFLSFLPSDTQWKLSWTAYGSTLLRATIFVGFPEDSNIFDSITSDNENGEQEFSSNYYSQELCILLHSQGTWFFHVWVYR